MDIAVVEFLDKIYLPRVNYVPNEKSELSKSNWHAMFRCYRDGAIVKSSRFSFTVRDRDYNTNFWFTIIKEHIHEDCEIEINFRESGNDFRSTSFFVKDMLYDNVPVQYRYFIKKVMEELREWLESFEQEPADIDANRINALVDDCFKKQPEEELVMPCQKLTAPKYHIDGNTIYYSDISPYILTSANISSTSYYD